MVVKSDKENKHLQWELESTSATINAVRVCKKGLRQVAKEFGFPVTSQKKRIARPSHPALKEEDKLYHYCLDMVDMG